MNIFTSLFLAFGLAMDAFAVAVARGSAGGGGRWRWAPAFRLAALFGFFQALMPVIGWSAGLGFKDLIGWFDHWLAFALLSAVGGKMIYDDLKTGSDIEAGESGEAAKSGNLLSLLVLAVATSIDAMAVGFSLTFLASILMPVLTIGLVTFALSLAGVYLGHKYRRFGRGKARLVGGLVLIGIGTKILFEHLLLF
ncbi:MAG TPA: manganese efflux pump MntP family protein [Pyrinomonadaceae bacterium]|nr:manganese efflux pump MntP family protein [Pyrinomonadaceae bacterium]